jgi:hypothetical protein
MNQDLTIVTGIWDIKREDAGDGFKRDFSYYTENFTKLLKTDIPMVIFVAKEHEDLVWANRHEDNTKVIVKEVEDFKKLDAFDDIQKIRKTPDWFMQTEWLSSSTQATLEMYNPLVMSKMFMLHDASIWNPFATNHFAWLDGGITSTVHEGYFTHDKVLNKVTPYLKKFFFLSYPYEGNNEIHGFDREGMNRFAESEYVKYVCRGGFFGGHIDHIGAVNGHYYGNLRQTLDAGYMGTEESIFTIMAHQDPALYDRFMIEGNGLVSTFFEKVKNDEVVIQPPQIKVKRRKSDVDPDNCSTATYVITFNSPAQFERLCKSWDNEVMSKTTNYLLDNSTDESTTPEYKKLCEKYNFEHIKKDNLGICGGRQWVAEHFAETDHDFYIFLEDDMLLNGPDVSAEFCKCGFAKYVPNLYNKVHRIMIEEGYDFLKMSFSEFYGDNCTQWSWYNVPADIRLKFWPDNAKLPKIGLSPDAPKAEYNGVKVVDKTPYTDGDVYYCNWPQIVSRPGNQRLFLDTKFAHPHEQTWMSFVFQEQKKGNIEAGILYASPITHDRFEYYEANERKEC